MSVFLPVSGAVAAADRFRAGRPALSGPRGLCCFLAGMRLAAVCSLLIGGFARGRVVLAPPRGSAAQLCLGCWMARCAQGFDLVPALFHFTPPPPPVLLICTQLPVTESKERGESPG